MEGLRQISVKQDSVDNRFGEFVLSCEALQGFSVHGALGLAVLMALNRLELHQVIEEMLKLYGGVRESDVPGGVPPERVVQNCFRNALNCMFGIVLAVPGRYNRLLALVDVDQKATSHHFETGTLFGQLEVVD